MSTVVFPGLNRMANRTPRQALSKEVIPKKSKVLVVILLLNALLMDEVATIKLEMISGRMSSFKSRMKSSPGKERTRSKSGGTFIGRRRIPASLNLLNSVELIKSISYRQPLRP